MMSLSKEWSIISEAMYGNEFKDELAQFLKKQRIASLLECGCGDGSIAKGLASRLNIPIVAIDLDEEMIQLAKINNSFSNVPYKKLSWLDLKEIPYNYDAVMCRGNSLSYATCWAQGPENFNPKIAKATFDKSIECMLKKINPKGLFYVDTVPQEEINRQGGEIILELDDINMKGKIEYDLNKKLRFISGEGFLNGEYFKGGSVSYLFTPEELKQSIKKIADVEIFSPKIKSEKNYEIICARLK